MAEEEQAFVPGIDICRAGLFNINGILLFCTLLRVTGISFCQTASSRHYTLTYTALTSLTNILKPCG